MLHILHHQVFHLEVELLDLVDLEFHMVVVDLVLVLKVVVVL